MHGDPVPGAEETKRQSWRDRLFGRIPKIHAPKINRKKVGRTMKNIGTGIAFGMLGCLGAIAFLRWPVRTAAAAGVLTVGGIALEKGDEIDKAKADVAAAAC
jgi:hypothetical protein